MQINRINTSMNFKAKFSPEFRDKITSLGEHLIEIDDKELYEEFTNNVKTLKSLYPEKTIDIIPYVGQKQICIWEYNKPGQTSTPEETKFCPNAHKTNSFIIMPVLQKVIALTCPNKRNLFISNTLPYNCDYISTDTLADITSRVQYYADRDKMKALNKPSSHKEKIEAQKAELKLLLDA